MLTTMIAFTEARITTASKTFKNRIEGATAIEYGLIAGGISLAIVAAVFAFGGHLSDLFDTIGGKMEQAAKDATATSGGGED